MTARFSWGSLHDPAKRIDHLSGRDGRRDFHLAKQAPHRAYPGVKLAPPLLSALLAGWTLTLVEGFVLPDLMNALEHMCYMASSVAAAGWCWVVLVKNRDAQ